MAALKILLVDDDPNIRQLLNLYLTKEGYQVEMAERGDTAVTMFKQNPPSIMLLDVMLPGMDGWQVLREVRKVSNIPIIMPFDPKEVTARIKAVCRRFQPAEAAPAKELVFPGLTVNLTQYEVTYRGQQLEVPPKELELLYFLCSHKNQVFTREQLLEQVWGYEFFGDSRTVDVHIKRLREKLTGCEELGWSIKTVWSVGYKFEVK